MQRGAAAAAATDNITEPRRNQRERGINTTAREKMSELDDDEQPPRRRIARCGSRRGRPATAAATKVVVATRPKIKEEKRSDVATRPLQAPNVGFSSLQYVVLVCQGTHNAISGTNKKQNYSSHLYPSSNTYCS